MLAEEVIHRQSAQDVLDRSPVEEISFDLCR